MGRERAASVSYQLVLVLFVSLALWAVASGAPQAAPTTEMASVETDAASKSSSSEEDDNQASSEEKSVTDDAKIYMKEGAEDEADEEEEESFKPVDVNIFLDLIPAWEVQALINKYYQHDEEVQRAYDFIKTDVFELLKVPEILALTNYMHTIGLDIVDLAQNVIATIKEAEPGNQEDSAEPEKPIASGEEQQGVHGLVNSILNLLSADQFNATFNDKVESDERFARFSKEICSPELKIILSNLYHSEQLRELFYDDKEDIYLPQIYEFVRHFSVCQTEAPVGGEYRYRACLQRGGPATPKTT